MFDFAVALKTEREAKEMYYCVECLHFKPDKVKKEGAFFRYGCDKRGYIPQAVKKFEHIVCGCGQFEEIKQLSLF